MRPVGWGDKSSLHGLHLDQSPQWGIRFLSDEYDSWVILLHGISIQITKCAYILKSLQREETENFLYGIDSDATFSHLFQTLFDKRPLFF